ncbi:hypothetical protein PybrP1_012415 [[Pythium] brassicae (nom. inval.)]|nr:hypothetical protein PybrP1_012415 [[Pythium] brassicae (nom. inval.)]
MTGIKAMSPLDALFVPGQKQVATLNEVVESQRAAFDKLQQSIEKMHKSMAQSSKSARARGRARKNEKKGTAMAQFEISDYVLYADVKARSTTKLSVRWCGPAQVIGNTSNWVFDIRHLLTDETRECHASRLKLYADNALDVSEELLLHVAHNSEGHVERDLLGCRYNAEERRCEVLVSWCGLSEAEDSWEPAQVLKEDLLALLKAFVKSKGTDKLVRDMAAALDIS